MNEHSKYGYWVTHPVHNPNGTHNEIPLSEANKKDGWKEVVLTEQQPATKPVPDNRVPEAWTNLLAYVLQDDLCNRTTPRITDIAYNAFLLAKRPNDEDGGASDWFNDTKPKVNEMIAKLRKDLIEELPGALHVVPNAKPLNAAEFEVDTYSPRGNGGFSQRSEVAVRIKHIPTGIETGSGGLRSQHANKQRAWELMQQALSKTERHYGPLRDADAEYGKPLSVYATVTPTAFDSWCQKQHEWKNWYYSGRGPAEMAVPFARRAFEAGAAHQAPVEAEQSWRKRADEIEVQVAHTGSQEAMSCYTDMRTLLQAATAQAAPAAGAVGWVHPDWRAEQGQGRIYGHNPGGYVALAPTAPASQADGVKDAHTLLQEVAACFTRDDDLPDNLLPRIDAVLKASKQGGD